MKFIIGGLLIVAAIVYLIVSSTQASAQYFYTVDELLSSDNSSGRDIRVSGAVLGDTIEYDSENLVITFSVAHVPGDNDEIEARGGLAVVLNEAVNNPDLNRIQVEYHGVMPDLLRNEAQAIMTGRLGDDGVFYADELLLKCPTKYEDAVPEQAG
jgi:cytochrome c-type biogenesis protein CcmE